MKNGFKFVILAFVLLVVVLFFFKDDVFQAPKSESLTNENLNENIISCINLESDNESIPAGGLVGEIIYKRDRDKPGDCVIFATAYSNYILHNKTVSFQKWYDSILSLAKKKGYSWASENGGTFHPSDGSFEKEIKASIALDLTGKKESFTTEKGITCPPFKVGDRLTIVLENFELSGRREGHTISCELISCPDVSQIYNPRLKCTDRTSLSDFIVPGRAISEEYFMNINSRNEITVSGNARWENALNPSWFFGTPWRITSVTRANIL